MEQDDPHVWWPCRKPTRLQLSLLVVVRHTESSDTLCSVGARTWTLWCRASYRLQWVSRIGKDWQVSCQKVQIRRVPVLLSRLRAFSPTTLFIHHHPHHEFILSGNNYFRLTSGRGGGCGALPCGTCPHPRAPDPSGTSRCNSSIILVRIICHIKHCILRCLNKSSRIWRKLCIT
jgi:hypothetical protein